MFSFLQESCLKVYYRVVGVSLLFHQVTEAVNFELSQVTHIYPFSIGNKLGTKALPM
nr:MAG TPA: hypothetical protein [Caudoviricetes sp.]